MPVEQPGLERRLGKEERRISSQHRQLDTLFGMLASAIDQGDRAAAATCFTRFADALDAHFSLEDGFYFPALHGLKPDLVDELEALSGAHASFRRDLDEIGEVLRRDLGALDGRLDAFVTALARHEGLEERLLARIRDPKAGS